MPGNHASRVDVAKLGWGPYDRAEFELAYGNVAEMGVGRMLVRIDRWKLRDSADYILVSKVLQLY